MKSNYIDLDTNNIQNVPIWQELKKEIQEFSKRRKELFDNDVNFDIEKIIQEYHEADDERKKIIEEMVIVYNFPIILIFTKKGYYMIKNRDYIKDLFNHLMYCTIEALRRYKAYNKNKFSTYLIACLRGEMIKFADDSRVVKYNYYYLIQRKKKDPLTILLESDINNILETEDSESITSYSNTKCKRNEGYTDFYIEKYNIEIRKLVEYFIKFVTEYEVDENTKNFLVEYLTSKKSSKEVAVSKIAEKYNKDIKECYKDIKKVINDFNEYAIKDNGELGFIYRNVMEEYTGNAYFC